MTDLLSEAHARIQVPVQLIWGTDDPFFPVARARGMVSGFGGPVSFEEIPGGKVFAHEDHAAEFAAHAVKFLA
jgi:pimeloyl-ACP methyl ester carboxylesterase